MLLSTALGSWNAPTGEDLIDVWFARLPMDRSILRNSQFSNRPIGGLKARPTQSNL